jgi:hypothetical protein
MLAINLNDVTAGLATLLKINVASLLGLATVEVSTLPPEKAEALADTRLNLYLHHISHDADGGVDLPLDNSGPIPIATRPLALKLFYVVTAHAVTVDQGDEDSSGQQMLMGCALKTLHDFPTIDSQLQLGGQQILGALGTRLVEIILRPVTPEEAISFWSTDQVRTARLAAFYEVRTLLLPPQPPDTQNAMAAVVALGVRPEGMPALTETHSTARVTLPAVLGSVLITQQRSPAVVALKPAADSDCQLSARGIGLGDGSDAAIVIRGEALIGAGLPEDAAIIEPVDNPAWNLQVSDGALTMAFRPAATVRGPSGPIPVKFPPGFYTLALRRSVPTASESGITRSVPIESNRTPFAAAPAITAIALDAQGRVKITVAASYDATDPANTARLAIGGSLYQQVTTLNNNPADRGHFAASASDTYLAAPLFPAPASGSTFAVGLTVNGVDTAPAWLEVP